MKLKDVLATFNTALSESHPPEEIHSFFYWLSEYYLGYSRFDVSLKKEETLAATIATKFSEALQRLKNHEPIQYIVGETEFYGIPFKVTPATLIPRPETEELVSWVISDVKKDKSEIRILDVGTGTGCIAISLAKELPFTQVSAIDISEEALQIATQNAAQNNTQVHFIQADILAIDSLSQSYDIIVSNPPYVRQSEKEQMQPNVLKHEPDTALFVSNDSPLLFYESIARLAKRYLTARGALYFEINEYLSDEMCTLLKAVGFMKIELKQDIFGKDRMIKCTL